MLARLRRRRWRPSRLLLVLAGLVAFACGDALPILTVTSPAHGTFTMATSITVTGTATNVPVGELQLTVNGVVTPIQANGGFSTVVPVSQAAILNPILLTLRRTTTGASVTRRVMVLGGPAVADGFYSANGIGMRLNNTGLAQLQPTIQGLINGSFDVQSLILAANPIIDDYCVINFFGCIASVDVNATSVTYTQPVGITLNAIPDATHVGVSVNGMRVNYRVSGSFSCNGHITANTTTVNGNYDQLPGTPASTIDVNQIGNVTVGFTSFDNSFDSGICDFPLIGSIIQLIIGDVQPLVTSGLVTNLRDPDGAGPQDAPIAAAIQSTLAGLEIAGPVGTALGVTLDAEFNDVSEDGAGLSYRIDDRVTQPSPTTGAPDQLYSYDPIETFPTFTATTPVSGLPYGLGLALSSGTFNQLLKAEVESGLLQLELTQFQGLPLTAGLLSLFLPEFGGVAPSTPLVLRVKPTLAPFVTGQDGPGGEISDLRVPQVIGTVIGHDSFGNEIEYLKLAFDARIGLGFGFDGQTSALVPSFGTIQPSDVSVAILSYLSGSVSISPSSQASLEAFLPPILALALPGLGSSLGSFPLPGFLGLQLQLVELRKVDHHLTLFLNLTP